METVNNIFQDRRPEFFGREKDVHRLTDRARKRGVTAVVAGPLMGKTWVLTEVARRLCEEGKFLVGYHESTATESSHLLYAVANLYARWLSDSTMRGQALYFWEKSKKIDLIPRIGTMVGTLFDKLSGATAGVGAIISASFNGLAEAQKDLVSGGLQLPTLSRDEVLALVTLVAKISERHVVLMLDAWEKAPSIRSDHATLESFLNHRDDWPETHFFLGIRNPDLDSITINDEAYKRALDLQTYSPAACVVDLLPISLDTPRELIDNVRIRYSAATRQVTDQELLQMIDGFPGVLNFWKNASERNELRTQDDLGRLARDAHALRYVEFDHLLKILPESPKDLYAFVARLAFFPRLNASKWTLFRELLLLDVSEVDVDMLMDHKVLENEADDLFPTFGHDTRHAAARRWFVKHSPKRIRRVAESVVESLATRIGEVNNTNRPFFEALAACFDSAQEVGTNQTSRCLIDAARSVFGHPEGIFQQDFNRVYPLALKQNLAFLPLISMSIINRGYFKGERGDVSGAIVDYTAAIELPNSPVKQVAMALTDRGIAKLELRDSDGAIADFTKVVDMPDAPIEQLAMALNVRGLTKFQRQEVDGAINDYTNAIRLPDMPVEMLAMVLNNRGGAKCELGDIDGAIADYTAALELPNAPARQIAWALNNRSASHSAHGDVGGALADSTAVIKLPDAPDKEIAKAFYNRGCIKSQLGDLNGAIDDWAAVVKLPRESATQLGMALFNRGVAKGQIGDAKGAIEDFTAAIDSPNVSVAQVAKALYSRGYVKEQRGEIDGAIGDYSAILELPATPTAEFNRALYKRGTANFKRQDIDGAIRDYTAVIMLRNVSAELLARALYNRGIAWSMRGKVDEAIADYAAAIAVPHAPTDIVAAARASLSDMMPPSVI